MIKETVSSSAGQNKLIAEMFGKETSVEAYQTAMIQLGKQLAIMISPKLPAGSTEICLACTVEDADFLAKGFLEELELLRSEIVIKFACFWNKENIDPHGFEDCDIAPVIKTYKEPPQDKDCTIIVIKSIISGACVVATNLTNLITDLNPNKIIIAAPVMHNSAPERLKQHFDPTLVKQFDFVCIQYVETSDRSKSVYEHYGFKNAADKNKVLPNIVKTRRKKLALA